MALIDDIAADVKKISTSVGGNLKGDVGGVGTSLGSAKTELDNAITAAKQAVVDLDGFVTGDLGVKVTNIDGILGDLTDKIKKAVQAVLDIDNVLNNALDDFVGHVLSSANLHDILGEILVKITLILREVVERLADAKEALLMLATDAAGAAIDIALDLAERLKQPFVRLADKLVEQTKIEECIKASFGMGAFAAFDLVAEYRKFLVTLDLDGELDARLDVVFHSMGRLLAQIGGGEFGGMLLGSIVLEFKAALKDILAGASAEAKLTGVIVAIIKYPFTLVGLIFEAAVSGKMWCFSGFSQGMKPGVLNAWLNDYAHYLDQNDLRKRRLEREFRVRYAAALDAYFRARGSSSAEASGEARINKSDERSSTEVLNDFIALTADVSITFILDAPCAPRVHGDLEHFEDVGLQLSGYVARQFRASVKATIGTVLRGAWVFSVGNDNIIEALATFFGSIVSATLEGMLAGIGWSLEIVSSYRGADLGGAHIVARWDSGEFEGTSIATGDRLEYVAFVRFDRDNAVLAASVKAMIDGSVEIKGAIKDLGAYLDISYRQFRVDSRFGKPGSDDTVFVQRAEVQGNTLTVWATTSASLAKPAPVLRVYVGCDIYVMSPGATPQDPYTLEISGDSARRAGSVSVLSSRGGLSEQKVQRLIAA